MKSLSLSNIELKYFYFQHLNFSSSTKSSCKFSYQTHSFTVYTNLCLEFTLNNFFQISITHGSLALCLSWSLSNALYSAGSATSPVSLLLPLPAGTQLQCFVEASSPTCNCQQEMLLKGIVKPHLFCLYNLKSDSYC